MQAIKLSKKYPEFKQEEIFDLINKFQCVLFIISIPPPVSLLDHGIETPLTSQANRCRR